MVSVALANGDPHTMITAPVFAQYTTFASVVQTTLASDSVFAFDVQPAGVLARIDFGAPSLRQSPLGSTASLLAMVERDDVFGYSVHGNAGWGQVYVLRADGTEPLLRSNAAAHVATPASDGAGIYWTETYGSQDVTAPQSRTELWAAPYTADPTQLAATAKRFATLPGTFLPLSSVAFGGRMAMPHMYGAAIGRLSDGHTLQVGPGQGRSIISVVALTASELWSIESDTANLQHLSLTRIALGTW